MKSSEIYLKDAGFKRIDQWDVDKQAFFIQICPEDKHICIYTPMMVKAIVNGKNGCLECEGQTLKQIDDKIRKISNNENQLSNIFSLIIRYPNCQVSKSIHLNGDWYMKFKEYKHSRDKYYRNLENIQDDNKDLEKLVQANKEYVNIIINLEREINRLNDKIKFYEEVLDEKNNL